MSGNLSFLRGSVRVELNCRYPERAVNICAGNHVDFSGLERAGDGVRMDVGLGGYMTLRRVAEETGAFSVKIVRRRGAPFLLWRVRKRAALALGLVLCFGLLGLSTVFVWQIDVRGNDAVPSSRILAALRSEGVDIGTCVLKIPQRAVTNRLLLKLPELSFITLNTKGSRLEVLVREKVPRPELYDPGAVVSVYAKKPGIITSVTATEGWAVRRAGETVDAGDELISAYVPLGLGRYTHASGTVLARTWYEMTVQIPLSRLKKEYTGEKTTRRAIILAGNRINLYISGGNPYRECDKITVYDPLELPGGGVLPLTVVTETFEEYESASCPLTPREAERMAKARLLYELEEEIGSGSIVETSFETAASEGALTVTMRAECIEDIAQERELSGAERGGESPDEAGTD